MVVDCVSDWLINCEVAWLVDCVSDWLFDCDSDWLIEYNSDWLVDYDSDWLVDCIKTLQFSTWVQLQSCCGGGGCSGIRTCRAPIHCACVLASFASTLAAHPRFPSSSGVNLKGMCGESHFTLFLFAGWLIGFVLSLICCIVCVCDQLLDIKLGC